jgi:hypothetical protein
MLDILSTSALREIPYCNPQYVQTLIEGHLSGKKNNWFVIWSLMILVLWHHMIRDQAHRDAVAL